MIFICLGEIRAEVVWTRISGKMPKHAKQKRGRLEIHRIGLHEGGLFLCKAVGHENEIGGQKLASVEVLKRH